MGEANGVILLKGDNYSQVIPIYIFL